MRFIRLQERNFAAAGRRLIVVLAALALSAILPGPTQGQQTEAGPTTTKARIARAEQLRRAGNLPAARQELELALKAAPNLAQAHLDLGMVEYQMGETTPAIAHLRRAAELLPNSFEAHYGLAMACLHEQKTDEGIHELERARAIDPRHPDAAYNLGIILLGRGKAADSERLFRETRALGQNRPDVSFYLIYAELEQRRFDDAAREAAESAQAFGSDAAWQTNVGRLFLEHHQSRAAQPHLEEALRLDPGSAEARRLLAAARLDLREPAAALEALPSAATAEDHYLRASAFYFLRRYRESHEECETALAAAPREPKYLLLAARVAQRVGDHDGAIAMLERAEAAAPQWAEPYCSQGVSYYLQRRYEDARRMLARALELDPQSSRALFLSAAVLVNQGKNREAEEYFRRALALEPANARFHYQYGGLLLRDNRAEEAQKAFEEAVRLQPGYAPPHYQLGKLLVRASQPASAARELEAAVRIDPALPQAYYQLSRAYTLLGEKEKAAQALATFNQLKKQQIDDEQEFIEGIRKDVEAP